MDLGNSSSPIGAIHTGLTAAFLGGACTMFGLEDRDENKGLAKELMCGAMEGILVHFQAEVAMRDNEISKLKEDVIRLEHKKMNLEQEIEILTLANYKHREEINNKVKTKKHKKAVKK